MLGIALSPQCKDTGKNRPYSRRVAKQQAGRTDVDRPSYCAKVPKDNRQNPSEYSRPPRRSFVERGERENDDKPDDERSNTRDYPDVTHFATGIGILVGRPDSYPEVRIHDAAYRD